MKIAAYRLKGLDFGALGCALGGGAVKDAETSCANQLPIPLRDMLRGMIATENSQATLA